MTINKFVTLNKMQQSLTVTDTPCFTVSKTWELKASHTLDGVNRSRCVAFIIKSPVGYTVTLNDTTHKTFMSALASLVSAYVQELYKLVQSMMFPATVQTVNQYVSAILNVAPAFTVPSKPVYDRGAKKEVLHPLRRAVTAVFGGKYFR